MNIRLKSLTVLALLSGLVACGESGGSGSSPVTFQGQSDAALALANKYEAAEVTNFVTLPTSGSARYDGLVGAAVEYADGSSNAVIGELQIVAQFSSDTFSGSASNFVDARDQNYTGTLALSNGTIARVAEIDDNQLEANFGGVLTDEDSVSYTISGELDGDFYGDNREAVGGTVEGISDSIYGRADLSGVFGAEQ